MCISNAYFCNIFVTLQVDFGKLYTVDAVAVRGMLDGSNEFFCDRLKISYSNDAINWTSLLHGSDQQEVAGTDRR